MSRTVRRLPSERRHGVLESLGLALLLVALSGAVCSEKTGGGSIEATGTVRHLDLEGGFYGIVADDSTQYDPVNLTSEFQQDGLRVSFTAKRATEQMSTRMWGTRVEIVSIRKL